MKTTGLLVAVAGLALLLNVIVGCSSSSSVPALTNVFMYAGNGSSPASIAEFTSSTTTVTGISGSPFLTGTNSPRTLAIASKSFLFAGLATGNGSSGGVLMAPIGKDGILATSTVFAPGNDYESIVVTRDGKFLYAADPTANQLAAYSIDSKGSLTAITLSPTPALPVNPDPTSLRVDSQGKFLYVMSCDCGAVPGSQGAVQVFAINTDGTLTPVAGSPFALGGNAHPSDAAFSTDGTMLFVSDKVNNWVQAETITNGVLSDIGNFPLQTAGSAPVSIAASPDGHFVYTADNGVGEVSSFSIGVIITAFSISSNVVTFTARNGFNPGDTVTISGLTTGTYLNGQTLTVQSVSPVTQHTQFTANFTHADVAGTSDLGVANTSSFFLFLLPNATSTGNSSVGGAPSMITLPSAGGALYAVNFDNGNIVVFTVERDGTLVRANAVNTGGVHPFGLVIDE